MIQFNFTLDLEEIQALINNSGANDLAKQMLTTIFNQLMEKQRSDYINVEEYSRGDNRVSQRNGFYERGYTTRLGTLELRLPRTRDGEFSPTIFERYQRNEKALISAMLEMYVQGVSTRKVSKVIEELCDHKVSKSFVSSLTSELDIIVEEFLSRRLEKKYPFIFSVVLYLKVRENRRDVSKAFHVVLGINEDGERELLGFSISDIESNDSWKSIYQSLLDRGLEGIRLVISDEHKGESKAVKECFTGTAWQRCQVHFMRNVLDRLPKKNTELVRSELKSLFKTTNIEVARSMSEDLVNKYSDQ